MLKTILSKVFLQKQWQTVLFTNSLEQFFEVKNVLRNNNIKFKTKTVDNNMRGRFNHRTINSIGCIDNYYEILVEQDDIYKTKEILRNR